MLANVAN